MIKNLKYTLLIVVLTLTASSCNKWLELKPQDGIVREDFWKTKEQLQSAVIGCYTALLNPTLVQNMFIWGELRADMVTTHGSSSFANANEVDFNDAEILSTNPLVNWSNLYTVINYCNTVIDYGPGVKENDETLTEQKLNAYLAEAKAIRAWMYFYLLRTWGEVPLQLKASSSDSRIEQLPKSSQEEIYNQIVEDLNFAAVNAVSTFGDRNSDKGRITRYSVYALQADVYLWMNKYEECIAACEKIRTSNRFGLIRDASQYYNSVFVQGNSNEGIFEIQFDSQALNPWFNSLASSGLKFKASEIVPELYGFNPDPSSFERDIRGENAAYRADLIIWKHVGTSDIATTVTATTSVRNWIVYRYADIELMEAEALVWSDRPNKLADALTLINDVRGRARALITTEEGPTDAQGMSDYILRERAREFAFEGKRWYDLLRHSKREGRTELIIDAVSKVAVLDKQQSIINKLKDPRSHYLPIAFSELQADKLLVQNPFYKN